MRARAVAVLVTLAAVAAFATTAVAAVQPYQTNDFGGFRNILPPGENGLATGPQIAQFRLTGARPPHNDDQLGMYRDLVYATPGLRSEDLPRFFKDGSFGVKSGDAERTYSPRSDVTIVRDKGFGIPHVYGETRAGAMFGAGYAGAEDRLFFMDVLRHLGRAQLSSFAGGAPGNRELDHEVWTLSPYTEADLQRQVDRMDDLYGADGAQVQQDADNYVAGVNKYIAEARADPNKMPGEYAAIQKLPEDWKTTDVIATAALIGGIFGKGGGGELDSALALQAAQQRFGGTQGKAVWSDFRSAEDPEAPTTVHGTAFPYEVPPASPAAGSLALPDPGTVQKHEISSSPLPANPTGGLLGPLPAFPSAQSNALVVSAGESQSGHPLAVFGPQTGYFAPQILMDIDIHAPGIDARGAAFPGVNQYVELGHGRDYSWSATSAGQDVIDTFAVDLCEPDGSTPTLDSTHYVFRGQCLPFETLERTNAWTPNAADQTPPGAETLTALRTKLGLVIARAKIGGKPVAYTSLRTTYFHEADSSVAFADLNNPAKINNASDFQHAAYRINYTFNWLYADDRDIAYFNSGANPVRAAGTDPNFPVRASFEWQGYDPDALTADYTPFAQHPQVVNQNYLTSWNNKQAPAYRAADNQFGYTSVYRSEPLDDRISNGIKGSRKMTLPQLVDAMETAGSVDLRADKVLPSALKILGDESSDPQVAAAITKLKAWNAAGSLRRDPDRDGVYANSDAIRILDAWWPLWIESEFKPALGPNLYDTLRGILKVDNAPNNDGAHLGSAYQDGWYGYAEKDLRTLLGGNVTGPYSRPYCGGGQAGGASRASCRRALADSLKAALQKTPAQVYPAHGTCQAGDQWCFDAIVHRPLGGITQPLIHWINRPTFQQAVEVQGHRPR